MAAPLLLAAFAVLAAVVGGRVLPAAGWAQRSPRWGIWAWQAISLSVAVAVLLAGFALALPLLPVKSHLAELVRVTPLEITEHYETPAGVWLAAAALFATAALAARMAFLCATNVGRAAHARRQQVEALAVLGLPDPDGYVLLEDDRPLVYCLPGRRRTVVVTSGAKAMLSPRELDLVLAHERAHLRARHDLALAVTGALSTTFGRAPFGIGALFRAAHEQVSVLAEMQADDSARARRDRRALAGALVTLSTGLSPSEALAAGDTAAVARVRRLTMASNRPLRARHGLVVLVATSFLLSTPVGLALAPAVEAAARDCCPAVRAR